MSYNPVWIWTKLLRACLRLALGCAGEPLGVGFFQGVSHIGEFAVYSHGEGGTVMGFLLLHLRSEFTLACLESLNLGLKLSHTALTGAFFGGFRLAGLGFGAALGLDFFEAHFRLVGSFGRCGLGLEIS